MNRHLIDVRVALEKIPADPEDAAYRAQFLLRPDVRWPMSVDGRTTLEDAIAFREASDRRVDEHAPFRLYALWQLRE